MTIEKISSEVWRPIKGYSSYEVSNLGHVRRLRTGKILKPFVDPLQEYPRVTLYDELKKKRKVMVHLLVADAFIPNHKNKPFIDHINTDKFDNRACNLRWVTAKENSSNPLTRFKQLCRGFKKTGRTETVKQLSLF